MRKFAFLFLLFAVSTSFAQGPLDICTTPDGQQYLHFIFAGTNGGIYWPSLFGPESQVVIHAIGGKFEDCKYGESMPRGIGHILKFDTGPMIPCVPGGPPGDYQTGTTCFGPGGKLAVYTSSENHLPQCSPDKPCVYKGAWVADNSGIALTFTQHVYYDAQSVAHQTYTIDGALEGVYDDAMVRLSNNGKPLQGVYAHYHADSCDRAALMNGTQCWAGQAVSIAPYGPM